MYPASNFVQKAHDLFLHDFSESSIKWKDRIVLLFCNLFSAKQAVRPDFFLDCLREELPNLKNFVLLQLSRISLILDRILGRQNEKENTQDLQALDLLFAIEKSLADKTKPNLSFEEKKLLSHLFNRIFASKEKLSSFENWLMLTQQSKERFKAFRTCKDLAKALFECSVDPLEKKLRVIEKLLQVPSEEPIAHKEKMTPLEYRFLFLAAGKKTLLNQLKELGISVSRMQELDEQWERLEALNASPVLKRLRDLAFKELEHAHLFFGHRFTLRKIRDEDADLKGMVKSLFIGTLNHVGIFTKGKTGVNLSHVGSREGKHTVKGLSDPLFFAFFRTAKLDISSLLPAAVSPHHKKLLCETFLEAFERLASEDRPEIAFDDNISILKTALIGHKNFSPTELSEVEFKPPQAMYCSVYVAMVFLQAIQQVNKKLLELEYSETIAHPFGRYESLNRMDALRFYWHFKRLDVIKPVTMNVL